MFIIAFVQQFLIASNIRNISQGRIYFAAATSFLIATGWGVMVKIVSSQINDWFDLIFYGLGASAGVICSILFDKYFHKKTNKNKA